MGKLINHTVVFKILRGQCYWGGFVGSLHFLLNLMQKFAQVRRTLSIVETLSAGRDTGVRVCVCVWFGCSGFITLHLNLTCDPKKLLHSLYIKEYECSFVCLCFYLTVVKTVYREACCEVWCPFFFRAFSVSVELICASPCVVPWTLVCVFCLFF